MSDKEIKDPTPMLYGLSQWFVSFGVLGVVIGIFAFFASSTSLGAMIILGSAPWILFGYGGQVLCRIAVSVETIARRK